MPEIVLPELRLALLSSEVVLQPLPHPQSLHDMVRARRILGNLDGHMACRTRQTVAAGVVGRERIGLGGRRLAVEEVGEDSDTDLAGSPYRLMLSI